MAAATPSSTPRRPTRFISDPVESPFPYNKSPLTTSSSPPSQPPTHNNHNSLFSSTQIREITTIFQLFNPTLSGYLNVETFEVMMLSLGYRVTRQEIEVMVQHVITSTEQEETTTAINNSIDLSMAMQILAAKGSATQQRSSEEEARMYFELFDVNDKGYITVEDLKRVQQEAVQLEQEMMTTSSDGSSRATTVSDEFVQAIIDKFDVNSTGAIEFEEFRRILHPILS
mmetsp:Transcript_20523/g.31286  ORF Transcript_20523/g.31286 Transcript_20523/m.31286 type:complete len:228 (-) Transcript_20523:21-704(-)